MWAGYLLNRAPARYGSNNYDLPCTRSDLQKTSFAFFGSGTLFLKKKKKKNFKSVPDLKIKLCKILISK